MALRSLSLFSGIGGLDLGLRELGVRAVCHVERDAYAAACLVARMDEASLDPAPVWDDVRTFDGRRWRGVVDCICGGFPCQDISLAGKRVGIGGERSGLWSEFARIVEEIEPGLVLIENVAALVTAGLDRVLRDLDALRFDAEWGLFRASDIGAPHRRSRLFILAYSELGVGWIQSGRFGRTDGSSPAEPPRDRQALANPDGAGCDRERFAGLSCASGDHGAFASRAGHDLDGCHVPFPPARDDADGWRAYLDAFPSLEPALRRGADGLANRMDRLRVLGNAVVPMQAAFAFRTLAARVLVPAMPVQLRLFP